jgi:hypothetical protein
MESISNVPQSPPWLGPKISLISRVLEPCDVGVDSRIQETTACGSVLGTSRGGDCPALCWAPAYITLRSGEVKELGSVPYQFLTTPTPAMTATTNNPSNMATRVGDLNKPRSGGGDNHSWGYGSGVILGTRSSGGPCRAKGSSSGDTGMGEGVVGSIARSLP